MALTESNVIDQIEITSNNVIQVRESIIIKRDEEVISTSFHRYTLSPIDDISNQDEKIKTIANAIWTPEVINTYKENLAKVTALENKTNP